MTESHGSSGGGANRCKAQLSERGTFWEALWKEVDLTCRDWGGQGLARGKGGWGGQD